MEALYSKYRPKVFSDVVGQKHILQTIENAIEQNKISHAYMFCGPRGTGKTTMARLLAKACMCKNAGDNKNPSNKFCGKCQDCIDIAGGLHPDVYELDAASRTGVENVREEIIGRVGFAATRGEKKIYIIDEVHMLSTAAFNALLKTLEEPPDHVIFILCTTDPQKVPETILSRCQRFNFSSISSDDIFNRLKYVCEQENVSAQDSALNIIAQEAQGAMRNALTKLEQVIAFTNGDVSVENLEQTMDSESQINYSELIENLGMRNLAGVFSWTENISNFGVDFSNVVVKLTKIFRDMYIKSAGVTDVSVNFDFEEHIMLYSTERLHRILIICNDLQNEMKTTTNQRLSFEIAMARIANPKSELNIESLAERISNLELVATAGDLSPAYAIENTPQAKSDGPKHAVENSDLIDEEKDEEVPRKVVKVIKEEAKDDQVKHEPKDEPEIKMPERPEARDFSLERQSLKEEAHVDSVKENEKNLNSNTELQKLWHSAFSKIKNKYPAFGATLLTATPSFDSLSNQFILSFPGSASFNVGVLEKPDSMDKIHAEIKEVMGEDVGFNIVIDDEKDESFNPQFSSSFRQQKKSDEEDISLDTSNDYQSENETSNKSSLTDMLNNFGAYNITEE